MFESYWISANHISKKIASNILYTVVLYCASAYCLLKFGFYISIFYFHSLTPQTIPIPSISIRGTYMLSRFNNFMDCKFAKHWSIWFNFRHFFLFCWQIERELILCSDKASSKIPLMHEARTPSGVRRTGGIPLLSRPLGSIAPDHPPKQTHAWVSWTQHKKNEISTHTHKIKSFHKVYK